MKIFPVSNIQTAYGSVVNNKNHKQTNQNNQVSNVINLNNSPVSLANKSLVSFKGYNNKYSYLFLNFDDLYNSQTEVLPKRCYSGFVNRDVYLSSASASAPLSQDNFWKLFSSDEFIKFLKQNPDLYDMLSESLFGKFIISSNIGICLQLMRMTLRKHKDVNEQTKPLFDFKNAVKERYNIDILKEPKYYRFIGKSELVKLLEGKEIEKLPPYYRKLIDITTNPELNWNKFRVTFKENDKFTNFQETDSEDSMVIEHDSNDYYYYLRCPYSLDDVEKIEMATPQGLLEFDLNHNYTAQELDAIDNLMFCN